MLQVQTIGIHDGGIGFLGVGIRQGAMGGQTRCAAEDIRVFAERIGGDESSAATTHHPRVLTIGIGRVSAIDEGFEFFDEETQVVIAQHLEVAVRVLAFGQELDDIVRAVFVDTFGGVIYAHHYRRAYQTEVCQAVHRLVNAPLLVVPCRGGIEEHLTVVHVKYIVVLDRRIAFGRPHANRAGSDIFRLEAIDFIYLCRLAHFHGFFVRGFFLTGSQDGKGERNTECEGEIEVVHGVSD